MDFKKTGLTFILLLSVYWSSTAQIALAVSKNDNGSSTKYSLVVGETIDEALANAEKALEEQDLENIFVLRSTEDTGHNLRTGHYVLIISSRKNGGRFYVSYGLGASENSRQEAEKRAIIHLKEHDWGYDKKFGHAIEKSGKIEDLFPSEEEK